MLEQMQLNTLVNLDAFYQNAAEMIVKDYDEFRCAGIQDGINF